MDEDAEPKWRTSYRRAPASRCCCCCSAALCKRKAASLWSAPSRSYGGHTDSEKATTPTTRGYSATWLSTRRCRDGGPGRASRSEGTLPARPPRGVKEREEGVGGRKERIRRVRRRSSSSTAGHVRRRRSLRPASVNFSPGPCRIPLRIRICCSATRDVSSSSSRRRKKTKQAEGAAAALRRCILEG